MAITCNHKDLCRIFQYQASWARRKITSTHKHSGGNLFYFYEETITQNILLYLAEHAGEHLKIKSYSRKKEHTTGADWLFCFSEGINNISILAQAKRLYPPPNPRYKQLVGTNQVNNLRNHAMQEGFIPLYVFFNGNFINWENKNYTRCSSCYKYPEGNAWGCSIAAIGTVKSAGTNTTPDQIDPMYPWHMLLNLGILHNPNGNTSKLSLPEAVKESLKHIYSTADSGQIGEITIRQTLPEVIKVLLENDRNTEELDNCMKENNIGHLSYIDATPQEKRRD